MNHPKINQMLLRFQQEYYKSNMKTSTFPRWHTTMEHSKQLSIDAGGSNVHTDVVDDSFHELMLTIYAVLQKNKSFDSSTVNNVRITSKLPYDTQPSFQNVYLITSSTIMKQQNTNTPLFGVTTGALQLQLYKYTLPNTQTQMIQDRARYMESFLLQMLSVLQNSNSSMTNRFASSSSSTVKTAIDVADHHHHHYYYSTFRIALQKFGGILYVVSYTDSQFC